MNQDLQNQIIQMKSQIEELLAWKDERTKQQLSYPFDLQSQKILEKYFLHITSSFLQVGGAAGRVFKSFFMKQDFNIASVAEDLSQTFTVDPSSDVFTVTQHPFVNDNRVYVFTSDTLPAPLDNLTTYYIINASGTTFKLSTSSGGSAVNVTNTGTGIHYINYL